MEGYIIRLRNLVIHARKVSKFDKLFVFNFFEFNSDIEFEEFRKLKQVKSILRNIYIEKIIEQ